MPYFEAKKPSLLLKLNNGTSPACPKDTSEEKMWKHEDISELKHNFHGKHASPPAISVLFPIVTE